MGFVILALVVAFSLLLWWAVDAGRPPTPRPMSEILAKEPSNDVYRPTGEPQKCHNCKAVLGVWYSVMLCDPCLEKQINNSEAEKRRKNLGETGKVDGAMSVDELERLWKK